MKQKLSGNRVLVLGGGIAGITAASELSSLGAEVVLVEKDHFIGGRGARLACKATSHCMKCNYCLVEDSLRKLNEMGNVTIETLTSVHGIEKEKGGFEVSLTSSGRIIDPDECTGCGECLNICPCKEKGAILTAPSPNIHPFYSINPQLCDCGENPLCKEACPEGAIDFERGAEEWSYECDGIVVATGFTPYDPSNESRYGLGKIENLITAPELEEMLRGGVEPLVLSDTEKPKIAFVQCVGSRNPKIHKDYCSRVCCGYAIRMALRLLENRPDLEITIFYMDIQNFGKDFQRYFSEAKEKIRFVRGLPGDYYQAPGGKVRVSFYDYQQGRTRIEDFDLLVLSVGISPNDEAIASLREMLGLEVDEMGFFKAFQVPQGIVITGTASGPMDVAETISNAKASALSLAQYLSQSG